MFIFEVIDFCILPKVSVLHTKRRRLVFRLLLCISEVPGSDLGPETWVFRGFSQTSQANVKIVGTLN
jgi:hypothetical protein